MWGTDLRKTYTGKNPVVAWRFLLIGERLGLRNTQPVLLGFPED